MEDQEVTELDERYSYSTHCFYAEPRTITNPDGTTGKSRSLGKSAVAMEAYATKRKEDEEAGVPRPIAKPQTIKRFEEILGEKIGLDDKYEDVFGRVILAYKQRETLDEDLASVNAGLRPSTEQMSVFLSKHSTQDVPSEGASSGGLSDDMVASLSGTVSSLGDFLASGAGDDFLNLMRTHETEHKNRLTALAVIDARIKETS